MLHFPKTFVVKILLCLNIVYFVLHLSFFSFKSNILKAQVVEKMMYIACLGVTCLHAVIHILFANKSRQTKSCQNGSNFRGSFSYGQLSFLVIFQNNSPDCGNCHQVLHWGWALAVCLHVLLHFHLLFIQTRMNYYEMCYACRLQYFSNSSLNVFADKVRHRFYYSWAVVKRLSYLCCTWLTFCKLYLLNKNIELQEDVSFESYMFAAMWAWTEYGDLFHFSQLRFGCKPHVLF